MGGIVAAVLVTLILLGLLIFGIWFAYRRGYFDSKDLPSKGLLRPVPGSGCSSRVQCERPPDTEPCVLGSSPREPPLPTPGAACWSHRPCRAAPLTLSVSLPRFQGRRKGE